MVLEASHIAKSFGDNEVLKDVSFQLQEGSVAVLMGTNGSGKTTLINILSGFLKPDRGEIRLNGVRINGVEPNILNLKGIGRTFQDMRLVENMTVLENVLLAFPNQEGEKWWKALLPMDDVKREQEINRQKANEILRTCFIDDIALSLAREVSYGQQKLLNLACCMACGTSVWLLDEPVAGVNPKYREMLSDVIKQEKNKGISLLIIEHNSDFITDVADEILFLNEGILRKFQSYEAYRNNKKVKEAYV